MVKRMSTARQIVEDKGRREMVRRETIHLDMKGIRTRERSELDHRKFLESVYAEEIQKGKDKKRNQIEEAQNAIKSKIVSVKMRADQVEADYVEIQKQELENELVFQDRQKQLESQLRALSQREGDIQHLKDIVSWKDSPSSIPFPIRTSTFRNSFSGLS
jgi:chromosome segregation ATPase